MAGRLLDQSRLDLEAAVREGRTPDEIEAVLMSFKRRDNLLAKVATRLDEALNVIDFDRRRYQLRAGTAPASARGARTRRTASRQART